MSVGNELLGRIDSAGKSGAIDNRVQARFEQLNQRVYGAPWSLHRHPHVISHLLFSDIVLRAKTLFSHKMALLIRSFQSIFRAPVLSGGLGLRSSTLPALGVIAMPNCRDNLILAPLVFMWILFSCFGILSVNDIQYHGDL
jgi:hypothetical protein